MTTNRGGLKLDQFGIAASALCGIYWIAAPILALLPATRLRFLIDDRTEWLLLFLPIATGIVSLTPSYFRWHGRPHPLAAFSIGVSLILVARLVFGSSWDTDASVIVIGAFFMAVSHVFNIVLCRAFPVRKRRARPPVQVRRLPQ